VWCENQRSSSCIRRICSSNNTKIFCLTGAIYAWRSFGVCEMLETFTNTTFAADRKVRESWPLGE